MKIKRTIYFLCIISGAFFMAGGERLMAKEYAMSIGIVLLMFGIYKTSVSWSSGNRKENEEHE